MGGLPSCSRAQSAIPPPAEVVGRFPSFAGLPVATNLHGLLLPLINTRSDACALVRDSCSLRARASSLPYLRRACAISRVGAVRLPAPSRRARIKPASVGVPDRLARAEERG